MNEKINEKICECIKDMTKEKNENMNNVLEKLMSIIGRTDFSYENSVMKEEDSLELHFSSDKSNPNIIVSFKSKEELADDVKEELESNDFRFVGVVWANGCRHTIKWAGRICRSPVWEHDSFVENQIEYVKILNNENCCDCSVVYADTFNTAKKIGIERE